MADQDQFDFKVLCDLHGFAEVSRRTSYDEGYLRQIYNDVRGAGGPSRKVMRKLREAFPEFSADADLDRELSQPPAA